MILSMYAAGLNFEGSTVDFQGGSLKSTVRSEGNCLAFIPVVVGEGLAQNPKALNLRVFARPSLR